jgi:hypothetical protein
MKLCFHDPDEFIRELREAPPNLEPLLRLTVRRRLDLETGAIHHLSVVATYLRLVTHAPEPLPVVVVLEAYQGEDWGPHFEGSRKTRERLEALLTRLRSVTKEMGLESRPGVYEASTARDSD